MAQTTEGISFVDCRASVSTNGGASWTDISGHLTSIEVGGGEREIAGQFTADGEYPIVGIGKQQLLELTVKTVYTESAGQMSAILENAYLNKQKIQLRWAPKGMASGNKLFTSDPGYIISPPWPGGEAGPGDILLNEWTLHSPRVVPSTQA